MESCSPCILSRRGDNLLAADNLVAVDPQSLGGLGSKSSKGLKIIFAGSSYSCFWKVATDIFKVDTFGAFHWHGRDVMGVSSSVSSVARRLGCN